MMVWRHAPAVVIPARVDHVARACRGRRVGLVQMGPIAASEGAGVTPGGYDVVRGAAGGVLRSRAIPGFNRVPWVHWIVSCVARGFQAEPRVTHRHRCVQSRHCNSMRKLPC
jgi:hypothetical protein